VLSDLPSHPPALDSSAKMVRLHIHAASQRISEIDVTDLLDRVAEMLKVEPRRVFVKPKSKLVS